MSTFTDEMDSLAAQLAKDANMAEKPFGDQIDAFKALMHYYALQMKNRAKDTEDDGLPDFDSFASSIHATETVNGEGEPGVRGGRRNGN